VTGSAAIFTHLLKANSTVEVGVALLVVDYNFLLRWAANSLCRLVPVIQICARYFRDQA
jgi:hypothetical protein